MMKQNIYTKVFLYVVVVACTGSTVGAYYPSNPEYSDGWSRLVNDAIRYDVADSLSQEKGGGLYDHLNAGVEDVLQLRYKVKAWEWKREGVAISPEKPLRFAPVRPVFLHHVSQEADEWKLRSIHDFISGISDYVHQALDRHATEGLYDALGTVATDVAALRKEVFEWEWVRYVSRLSSSPTAIFDAAADTLVDAVIRYFDERVDQYRVEDALRELEDHLWDIDSLLCGGDFYHFEPRKEAFRLSSSAHKISINATPAEMIESVGRSATQAVTEYFGNGALDEGRVYDSFRTLREKAQHLRNAVSCNDSYMLEEYRR